MTAAAAARVVVALSLVCASYARAGDRAGAAANLATPPSAAGPRARDAHARPVGDGAAQDPSKRPPPAVIVLPLVGLVLLPLTLPVADPRGRRAAANREARPPGAAPAGSAARASPPAITAATAPAATASGAAPAPAAQGAPAREAGACPPCADVPRTAGDPGGARP